MKHVNKLNVLIVEDEPLIALFIKNIVLSMNEYIAGICYNSDDAIEIINEMQPDLIFMDINIQGPLDGINVLRAAQVSYEPTVFFISAYSDKETINDALSLNPYHYLIKPLKEQDIEIAIMLARKAQNKSTLEPQQCIFFKNKVYFDIPQQELYIYNKPFLLSGIDRELLLLFMQHINTNLTLEKIKQEVWGDRKVSKTTIRDAISNFRKKVPELDIQTNFGRGYSLVK
jgi:DNA-binding response OmpR family regulator